VIGRKLPVISWISTQNKTNPLEEKTTLVISSTSPPPKKNKKRWLIDKSHQRLHSEVLASEARRGADSEDQ
jgi:hypothetical protein